MLSIHTHGQFDMLELSWRTEIWKVGLYWQLQKNFPAQKCNVQNQTLRITQTSHASTGILFWQFCKNFCLITHFNLDQLMLAFFVWWYNDTKSALQKYLIQASMWILTPRETWTIDWCFINHVSETLFARIGSIFERLVLVEILFVTSISEFFTTVSLILSYYCIKI